MYVLTGIHLHGSLLHPGRVLSACSTYVFVVQSSRPTKHAPNTTLQTLAFLIPHSPLFCFPLFTFFSCWCLLLCSYLSIPHSHRPGPRLPPFSHRAGSALLNWNSSEELSASKHLFSVLIILSYWLCSLVGRICIQIIFYFYVQHLKVAKVLSENKPGYNFSDECFLIKFS